MAEHSDTVGAAGLPGAALVLAGVLAGGNAVAVRFSNRELDPLWGAGLRFSLASAALGFVVLLRRSPWPRGRALFGVALFGVLNFAGAFGFAYYALVHLQAGFASTLLALVPLVTLGLAVAHHQEQLRARSLLGGLLAVMGVGVLTGAGLPDGTPVLALLAGLASVLCFAEAAVLRRSFPPVPPAVTNAVAMAVGAAVLLASSALAGETWELPRSGQTWWALAYLVVGGSIGVFLLYLFLLKVWEASRAAYMDVIIPPVAVGLSAWLDEERPTAGLLVGGPLVLLGVYLGALRPTSDEREQG